MGRDSKISWTNHTWNPWIGCTKVSPGCARCYAETLVEGIMGRDFREVRRSTSTFDAPLRWKEPALVFTCSLSDFFHEAADPWRDEAWEIIRKTPHLTYQILTKRPERIAEHLPKTCFECGLTPGAHVFIMGSVSHGDGSRPTFWPWPNVWLGTSVETQQFAEKRIPELVKVPAVIHFLSCEPLLGPIDFGIDWVDGKPSCPWLMDIEWVIVGGESGPNFRIMDADWARSILDQCRAAGVPFFGKQSSGPRSEMPMPSDLAIREMPTKPLLVAMGRRT